MNIQEGDAMIQTPALAVNEIAVRQLTMSTLEIAGLTGKRHDNVLRDSVKMLEALGISVLKFEGCYRGENGKDLRVLNLPKRECMILVSGYNVDLRARIIDRWMDLPNYVLDVPRYGSAILPALDRPKTL